MIQAFTHDIKRLIEVTPVQDIEGETIVAKVYKDGCYKGIANTVRPDEDSAQLLVSLQNSTADVQVSTATVYGKNRFETNYAELQTIDFSVAANSTVDLSGSYDPQDFDEFKAVFDNNALIIKSVGFLKLQYQTVDGIVIGGKANEKVVVPCDFRNFEPAEEYRLVFIAEETGVIGREILTLFDKDGYGFGTEQCQE